MESPDNRVLLQELLATNRELTSVNQQIAQSLADLEKMYAEDVQQRHAFSQKSMRRIQKMSKMTTSWTVFFPAAVMRIMSAAYFGVPRLMRVPVK